MNERKDEIMFALNVMFVITLVGVLALAGFAYYCVMAFMKLHRAKMWVEAHPGILIGDNEFFEWCHENGVNPNYYL